MIPCRNLDAPDEKDVLMTKENKAFIRDTIVKELGSFFNSVMWRGEPEEPIIEYLSESLASERGLSISECRDPVRRMVKEYISEIIAETDVCVKSYHESFPWEIVEKCLRDERFSNNDMSGPRNKISQWLPSNINDPFLSVEMPIVIMAVMDIMKAYESKMHGNMEKAPYRIEKDKLVKYVLIDFKINSGRFRFTHYNAMTRIVPDLVERLVPLLKECGVYTTSLC